jgi:hypothetical protein
MAYQVLNVMLLMQLSNQFGIRFKLRFGKTIPFTAYIFDTDGTVI